MSVCDMLRIGKRNPRMVDNQNPEDFEKIRIAPEDIDIGDNDGFEKNDIFGYANFGNNLANIFQRTIGLRTVLLDDEWGSGKTIFVKQWAGLMRQQKASVIYIDAFENDYQSDPFLMLVNEITISFKGKSGFTDLVSASAKALETVLSNTIKLQSLGIIDTDKIFEAFKEKLNSGDAEKKSLSDFRTELDKIARKNNQLVIIIDELDRCRPDFALRLLERVKHLFDVEGVSFLLVASSSTLIQMVRHAYGFTEDQAVRYLDKFLNLRVSLPRALGGLNANRREIYADYLAKSTANVDKYARSQYGIYEALGRMAIQCGADLRTIEKIYFNFISVCVGDNFQVRLRSYVISLCLVKTITPDVFRDIVATGSCNWGALSAKLRINDLEMGNEEAMKLWPILHILTALFAPPEHLERLATDRENPFAEEAIGRGFSLESGGRLSREKMAKFVSRLIEDNISFN